MSRREQLTIGELTVGTIKFLSGGDVNGTKVPVYSGLSVAETDADASVVISVTGVRSTDVATAVMVAGATPQPVKLVACTTNTITVTLAGNGGAGTQVFYTVYR